MFDVEARLEQAQFGNGAVGTWGYDPVRSVLRSIEYGDGSQTIAAVSYPDIDANGNIEREIRYDLDGNALGEKVVRPR